MRPSISLKPPRKMPIDCLNGPARPGTVNRGLIMQKQQIVFFEGTGFGWVVTQGTMRQIMARSQRYRFDWVKDVLDAQRRHREKNAAGPPAAEK